MIVSNNGEFNYTPLRLSSIQNKKRSPYKRMLILLFFITFLISITVFFNKQKQKAQIVEAAPIIITVSPTPTPIPISPTPIIPTIQKIETSPTATLGAVIEKELIGTKGTYGIVVKNLKTGESYNRNEHRKFEPASIYKIWIMATVYDQIKNGTLTEDEVLQDDVVAINQRFQIATEDAELKSGIVKFTVKEALEQMITNSHNYASLLLSTRIRLSNVKSFLFDHGLNESLTGQPPQTTPSDVALFFEKLYNGELNHSFYTQEMIALLKRQNLNNVLPKYLPDEVGIAHKTGELNRFAHDAGIFYEENGDYIMAGFSESDFYPDAEDRLAKVSRAVYEYFSAK